MNRQIIIVAIATAVLWLVVACGPGPIVTEIAPTPKAATPAVTLTAPPKAATPAVTPTAAPKATTPAAAARPAWEEEWERTLSDARREGSVVVYTGFGAEFRTVFTKAMKEKFGIDAEFVSGRSAEIAERVMTEQRSERYVADVIIVGLSQHQAAFMPAKVPQPLKPVIIRPDVLDPKAWWEGKLPWVDKEATVLEFYAFVNVPFAINTDLVKPEEFKSYWDLLKFKGKIVTDDPAIGGPGQRRMAMTAYGIMGWDYVEAVAKLEPAITRDRTQQLQWLTMGRYTILIGPEPDVVSRSKKAGAPLGLLTPVEGAALTPGFGCVSLPRGAPHPNAAKVFINFLLSREGQTLASVATGSQSGRIDVPTDHLDPDLVRRPGVKYIANSDPDFMAVELELGKRVADLFKRTAK